MSIYRFLIVALSIGFLFLAGIQLFAAPVPGQVTLQSLLNEMIDRDALARWPVPAYQCKEFTSYDRRSISPDQPGWFANNDFSNFLRTEENQGRKEWVMMDVDGPGAIVCMFKATTDPEATIRIYLDNNPIPVIAENFRYLLGGAAETDQESHFSSKRVPPYRADEQTFLGGYGTIKPPFASVESLGSDLYFPIPYAKHCKITYDKPGKCYYRFNYRTYPPGAPVETFTLAALKNAAPLIDKVGQALMAPAPEMTRGHPSPQSLNPGESVVIAKADGPSAIKRLALRLKADDMPQALRSTILKITFDGTQTVWCPIGDFFGSGIGLHSFQSWDFSVSADGAMKSYWVMPFQKNCEIELQNLGSQTVEATCDDLVISPWKWDSQSMYFHADWRQQYPIHTKAADGTMDWNYIEVAGRGVYVGDSLVIYNGCNKWWGEGDEKIYLDSEPFPSHFGTGTEDYYGYSRGGPPSAPFQSPFLIHQQIEGDKAVGYSSPIRLRTLDAMPFSTHLKFDMEIWSWGSTEMAYAVATYWYGMPGITSNHKPDVIEASRPILPDATLQRPVSK